MAPQSIDKHQVKKALNDAAKQCNIIMFESDFFLLHLHHVHNYIILFNSKEHDDNDDTTFFVTNNNNYSFNDLDKYLNEREG